MAFYLYTYLSAAFVLSLVDVTLILKYFPVNCKYSNNYIQL